MNILKQVHKLKYDYRRSIKINRSTIDKINKIIGAAMYHRGEKVGTNDIIAHAVDYFYTTILHELNTAHL